MESCIFCQHLNLHSGATFEIKGVSNFFYYWDIHPVSPGHLLVIPKKHIANYKDLSKEELNGLSFAVLEGYKAIEGADLGRVYAGLMTTFTNEKTQDFLKNATGQLKKFSRKPDGYNHGLNDGKAAGKTIDHLHYHIIPRWLGDSEDPRGGIRHMFDGMGNYQEGIKR